MVLIIHTTKSKARAISDIFYYMGIISYPVTPTEALTEISGMYRAVLISDPEKLPDVSGYTEKLRAYNTQIPIFAISDAKECEYEANCFDGCFPNNIYSSRLVEEIVRYQKEHKLPMTTRYCLAGIDASCERDIVTVFDKPVKFTKTETMILRYLIASYPTPKDAKNILNYAFKPLRKPEETSIRTHICIMNKKFRDVKGKNLFYPIAGKGYVVSTPEILRSVKEEDLLTV